MYTITEQISNKIAFTIFKVQITLSVTDGRNGALTRPTATVGIAGKKKHCGHDYMFWES